MLDEWDGSVTLPQWARINPAESGLRGRMVNRGGEGEAGTGAASRGAKQLFLSLFGRGSRRRGRRRRRLLLPRALAVCTRGEGEAEERKQQEEEEEEEARDALGRWRWLARSLIRLEVSTFIGGLVVVARWVGEAG
ncbi:hypothetical protein MPTK1_4g17310 [Marchantia polymorpha subsp. ruderalis]|uniref:Uncharacterized protein n=2 Tax=Marchantia polymorpha TaxID=3197 RepID=A0AAF6BAT9_MARPO|nr:hypothetical protein MARPO_0041s0013 [Marchantia polymorpha]BBN09123.1 hypothetical protein Mp_4g17310 [Marchantia polymorpha subsp. ruderalis]|eukprot:PTQ40111.1 hypothetical protein MARPO_0041s0013 [Marchantia polymorpha]